MNDSDNGTERPDEYKTFVEGVDFYFDDGLMVLTGRYLVARGKCCGNSCRHCPFENGCKLK